MREQSEAVQVATVISTPVDVRSDVERGSPAIWIYLLFFLSGIPAIFYQIVWQRSLFALFGINIESVTIVVSAFMLGLGIGSLVGGAVSRSRWFSPLALFGAAELGTAVFALLSLGIFHFVAEYTRSKPLLLVGVISFLLVVFPTILMGCTLPLLIEHLTRISKNVGSTVGALYFVNTLGSGAACAILVRLFMNRFGQAGTVRWGAAINALVGISALIYDFLAIHKENTEDAGTAVPARQATRLAEALLPFRLALLCAAFCGFTALCYEIVWYRFLAFALRDTAPTFASLLGSYLIGIALGSRFAEGYAERHTVQDAVSRLSIVMLGSTVVAFWVNPIAALALKMARPVGVTSGLLASFIFLVLICHTTILFGALFPLIAHVSVGPQRSGTQVSYLYAANIAGSTIGTLLIGFILMDRLSTYQIALILLITGIACTVPVFLKATLSRARSLSFAFATIGALCIAPFSHPIFSTVYDRLLFKNLYPAAHFSEVIESRSGTIAVTPDGTLYGGGVYDGRFNTDLLNDTNIILRPYAIGAFHKKPAHVLMIGLGSGSWGQVIANEPDVQDVTVVEISGAYLKAIGHHPETASLLHNPKVSIVVDDGRRWLLRHPDSVFDLIVMNTSFYWRNHSSNLLSSDFLRLVRPHLRPHGIFFYNTTSSDDVVATGLAVYPYALRVANALALSDSPITFDPARWKSVLLMYSIDGKQLVNPDDAEQMRNLDEIVNIRHSAPDLTLNSIEDNEEIRARLKRRQNLIITDDNMGVEWR